MLAIAPAAAMLVMPAMGATSLTWDPSHTLTVSDANGNWDLVSNNWATGGSDTVWLNDGTGAAIFGIGAPATVTITAPGITAVGVTFNQGYTLGATAGNSLTIGTGGVTVAAGQAATISAPIAGTSGLAVSTGAGGSLTLSGINTYTGNTTINGAAVVAAGGTLGAATNGLVFGTNNTTTVGGLTLNGNLTVGSLTSTTSGGSNTIALSNSSTFTDTGAVTLGFTLATAVASNTSLTISGDGSNTTVNLSGTANTNFSIGSRGPGSGSAVSDVGYFNVATVANFIYNTGSAGTGNFIVGQGTRSQGFFVGASNNSITAANVIIGDSNLTDGGNQNSGGTSNLALGGGTNVIDATKLIIGNGKAGGLLTFSGTGGTLVIAGQTGGSSTADIAIGTASIGGGNNTVTSTLALAGHNVVAQVGTLSLGNFVSAGTGSTVPGVLTFDTGTFTVANVIMGNISAGGSTAGPNGNITIGGTAPNATATGVFNVVNSFLLANNSSSNTTAFGNGTLTINGGTVNSSTDILRVGKSTTVLSLNGGTLNLNGHAIGSTAAPITTVNLAGGGINATLANLGGTGINGLGLTASGNGTLILTGNNTYTGGTTVGTNLQVGSATTSGSLPSGGAVVNNGTLTFAGAGTSSIGNLSGAGTINANAGAALVGDPTTNYSGPVTIAGGAFGGVGTLGTVNLNSGTLQAGASSSDTSGVLNVGTVNVSGGSLGFNLGASGSSSMSVGSLSAAPTLSFTLVGSVVSGTQYTVLTDASTLPAATFAPFSVGRNTVTAVEAGNTIVATVTGTGPANLIYRNQSGTGLFDVHGSQNFLNGASPDFFFQFDNVTFNDTNTTSHVVGIPTLVTPSSIVVSTASSYTFNGAGSIGGNTTLAVNGGTVILGTANNTYTGATSINSGTLQLAATGALPTGNAVSISAGSTLDINGNAASVSALSGSGTVRNSSVATPAIFTYAGSGNGTFAGSFATTAGASPLSVTIASGNLTLTNASTYVGSTTIAGGAGLTIGNGGSTGSLSSTTAIANGGTLTFNGSTPAATISNNILGVGSIVQAGSNALTFTGNVSFGGLNIAGGSVQFGNGAATTLAGSGAINANGNLIIDTSTSVTLASAISGTGSVTQLGSGVLTLGTAGTFSGGLIVSNGTVGVIAGTLGTTSAGTGDITVNAGGTLIGNGQDAIGYNGGAGSPANLTINGGTVTDKSGAGYRITLPNVIFTGGTLTSAANANSTTGQYSFQGPQSATSSGPASVTTNAAASTALISAVAVSVENPLTFTIASGTTPSGVDLLVTSIVENYNAVVSNITVNGPGTLALAANNTFTGGITINSGTLQIGSGTEITALNTPLGAATGAVVNNSLIKFASGQAATVANSITGTGSVVVSSGTAVLNGANTYAGNTTLNGGTLAGTGSITSSVVAGIGPHAINPGLVGAVGTLTVGGLATNGNTTLAFDLAAPAGTNDLLAVTGNVVLGGGKLTIASQTTTGAGSLGYYKVLTYTGSLTGSTSGIVLPAVMNNIAYTLDTTHDANAIDIHRGYIGDATDDGVVDLNDLNIVLNNLGSVTSSWGRGNFDGAATIDLNDLNAVLNHLGTSIPTGANVVAFAESLLTASPSAVPEPASLGMLAIGGALLLRRRRQV